MLSGPIPPLSRRHVESLSESLLVIVTHEYEVGSVAAAIAVQVAVRNEVGTANNLLVVMTADDKVADVDNTIMVTVACIEDVEGIIAASVSENIPLRLSGEGGYRSQDSVFCGKDS